MVRPPEVRVRQPDRPRPLPAMPILLALALALALASPAALGDTDIQARLSAQTLSYGQPVELTLEVRGDSVAAPDLSVLEADFRILDRRVARQVSVRNGLHSSRVQLALRLLPRRDGDLIVPAIPFGQARSQPLTLTVAPAIPQPKESPGEAPLPPPPELWPPDSAWSSDFSPPFSGLEGPPSHWAPTAPIDLAPDMEPPPARPRSEPEPQPHLDGNPWFWISLGLAGALVGLLAKRRRLVATPRRTVEPSSERKPEPPTSPSPLDLALDRVRTAYAEGDARMARESLLAWARLRWPEDPPGNLARLAQRCPSPLREHVTRLEMAFFSPSPLPWEHEPVATELAKLAPKETSD